MKRLLISLLLFLLLAVPTYAAERYNLTTVSALTSEQLEPLMHPETQHLAGQVVDICAEHGVSAEFITAVMRLERNIDIHNYFGWSWGDGSLVVFDSDEECLQHCIPLIKENYLTEDGLYFNGYTVSDVSVMYNNTDAWREFIIAEIEWIFLEAYTNVLSPPSSAPSIPRAQLFIDLYQKYITER